MVVPDDDDRILVIGTRPQRAYRNAATMEHAAAGRDAWHPRIVQIHDYWMSIRPGPDLLPGRAHIKPHEIAPLLPSLWMLDVQRDPFRLRFRLVGTRVVQAVGTDSTGKWMDERWPTAGPRYFERYAEVVKTGRPSWRRGPPDFHSDPRFTEVESILLPLATDGITVDILLALSVFYRNDGREF